MIPPVARRGNTERGAGSVGAPARESALKDFTLPSALEVLIE
jgi:hypothetical protein